jgi:UPF0271 protein
LPDIDMNADLGEGDPYDAELLTIVSSCNVACGGHAVWQSVRIPRIRIEKGLAGAVGFNPVTRYLSRCLHKSARWMRLSLG